MTQTVREQINHTLDNMPEDAMSQVLGLLNGFVIQQDFSKHHPSQDVLGAWENLKKYKGIIDKDIDIKKELIEAREDKYASIT
jgi:hypothetical protein